jgi:hypothetical protein
MPGIVDAGTEHDLDCAVLQRHKKQNAVIPVGAANAPEIEQLGCKSTGLDLADRCHERHHQLTATLSEGLTSDRIEASKGLRIERGCGIQHPAGWPWIGELCCPDSKERSSHKQQDPDRESHTKDTGSNHGVPPGLEFERNNDRGPLAIPQMHRVGPTPHASRSAQPEPAPRMRVLACLCVQAAAANSQSTTDFQLL